jgi:DoxX-like family
MSKLPWKPILAWILAAFFVFGGAVNIFAPESVAADYQRWEYPDWFHFATGGLELTTAVLLALAGTRLLGAALGSVVMLAATATVMVHGEHAHAILPIMILALLAIAGRTSRPIATITVEQ